MREWREPSDLLVCSACPREANATLRLPLTATRLLAADSRFNRAICDLAICRPNGITVQRAARLRPAVGRRCARRDGRSGRAARDRRVGTDGVECVAPVGDRPGAPPTVRCQHTMVQDKVYARARRERRQPFEKRLTTLGTRNLGALSIAGTRCTVVMSRCASRSARSLTRSRIAWCPAPNRRARSRSLPGCSTARTARA